MDDQSKPINLNDPNAERRAILFLSLGFLFLCFGSIPALEGSFLTGMVFAAIGCILIIYCGTIIKLAKMGQFVLGFLSWFIASLFINMFVLNQFDNPRISEIAVLASMTVPQLFAYGLAFLTFRKRKRWIGIGIIIASIPYLVGFIARDGSGIIGLPFPFSLIPFGGY